MKNKLIPSCVIIMILPVFVFALTSMCAAADSAWTAGVRSGGSWTERHENFRQNEVFFGYKLPWRFHLLPSVILSTHLEATLGTLSRRDEVGIVGSLGPEVALEFFQGRLWIRGGASATGISERIYGNHDLGGSFQFTSHVGLGFRIIDHLGIGYRFQHMSNAGFYYENPGLNMHMIEARWDF